MKRQHLEEFLQRGMVMLHIDSRQPGVDVPAHLRGDSHLKLNLSYRFRPFDLETDAQELRITLSFGGRPYACTVPFSALFSLTSHVNGESLLWVEDVPAEVLTSLVDTEQVQDEIVEEQNRPGLRLVSVADSVEHQQRSAQSPTRTIAAASAMQNHSVSTLPKTTATLHIVK